MSLTAPRGQFGVHSVCLYDRDTSLPLAYLRVIGECSVSFEAEFADLMGGSQMYAWDSEVSKIGSDIKFTAREYDAGTMELLMGGSLTENAAEASGAIDGLANVYGTSVYNVSTGITAVSVTSGDSTDLKEGKYVIKATAAKTATVYCLSDVDFAHGTDGAFEDDTLSIGDIDLSSGDDTLDDYGLTFEVGSGTTAFVTNDTAEFYVRKPNASSVELVFGQSGAEFTKCGVIIAGQKSSDGSITYLELYNCLAAGMPISFNEKAWSEWSVTIKSLYDSSRDAIGKFYRTIAS
ncbi:MAG: hypothetical protein JXA20_17910 [Spirochaetes bacterium]|nr:hypothetical protein [Spirochaetota bacterium]